MNLKASPMGLAALCALAAAASPARADELIFADGHDYAGCPAGRQIRADIGYRYNLTDANVARNVDVTQADNIWGRTAPNGTILEFPWANYFAVIVNLQRDGYVAALWRVPPDAIAEITGMFSHGETMAGPNVDMSISQYCGDFEPGHAICLRTNTGPGGILTKYKMPEPPGFACPLVPGNSYFVNIRMTNPDAMHHDCDGATCTVTIQNNWSD